MLGPLPPLHRWVVCIVALLVCVGLGTWLAFTVSDPQLAPRGARVGAGLGVVVVLLLLRRPNRTR